MSYKDFEIIQFNSPQMSQIMNLTWRIVPQNGNVLISGSAGTGKTSLAKFLLHKSNHLNDSNMIFDCQNLNNFDGILKSIEGLNCHILFENVDALTLSQQKELLKVLKTSSLKSKRIFTTRKNLINQVIAQTFLDELFYLISVINLQLPELAERPVDLSPLINYYLHIYCALHSRCVPKISESAAQKLFTWRWPGNLRELENVIERSVLLCDQEILAEHIQFDILQAAKSDFSVGMTLSEVEKQLILQTLALTSQNRTKAAQVLGISIRTLRNKLNEYKNEGDLCESNI